MNGFLQKILLISVFAAMVLPGAAALESKIAKNCDGSYQPLISMEVPENRTNNPGIPGMYEYQVCVSGLEDNISIESSCPDVTGFYLSSKDRDAHISKQNSYYWGVCTGRMTVRITDGAKRENETTLFSVSDTHNGHVAEPGVFDYTAYGKTSRPENVTLEMEFNLSSNDDVYFDDETINGEQKFVPPAVFPHLVSESNSYVSGIVSSSFMEAERKISSENRLSMTKPGSAEFIVPFTSGSHSDIEGEQQEILNSDFQDANSPNFGFRQLREPIVNVRVRRSELVSNLSIGPGNHRINITKTGRDQITIEEILQ